jgi:hypothetical protein
MALTKDDYAKGMRRLDSGGALLVLKCTKCGLGWEAQLSREQFSDFPGRERTADQWADLLMFEHDRQQHPEPAQPIA